MAKNKTESDNKKESKVEDSKQQQFKLPINDLPRKYVIIGAIVLIVLGAAGYFLTKWMTVAKVNGEVISRTEYTAELEKTAGKQVLEGLTTKKIIQQEAKAKNVSVSDEEINAEIKKIDDQLKTQGQNLDQILAFQGLTRDGLREQIVIQKMVEKLVGNVQVASEEIETYIEQNQELAGENTDLDSLRTKAAEDLKQQKTDQKIQQLIQDLRKKAKIEFYNE